MRGPTSSADPGLPEPAAAAWAGRAQLPAQSGPTWVTVDAYATPARRRPGLLLFVLGATFFALCGASGATLAFIIHSGPPSRSAIGSAPPGLGSRAKDGQFEFVVAAVSCGHATVQQGQQSRTAHGQYCLVTFDVTNTGSGPQSFAESYQKAISATGAVYGPDTVADGLVNAAGTGGWTMIGAGRHAGGTLVFDIPKDAAIATVELHDSAFSRGARVIAT